MQQEVKDWLEQAKRDFQTAKNCFKNKDYYAAVNFAQQCAEKSLKALYISNNRKIPPKIHDLIELCRLITAPPEVIVPAGKLTVTFLSSRYPGAAPVIPAKFYDQEKAKEHLQEARFILQWVKEKL